MNTTQMEDISRVAEKTYKINEVAIMHNLSKKTLLHYDKVGLLHPKFIDSNNGYRYYVREQFPTLKAIIYLKNLGMPLEEIKLDLDNRNLVKTISFLDRQQNRINDEINQLLERKQGIEYRLNFYKHNQYIDERDLYKPLIKIQPKRKLFYLSCEDKGCSEEVMMTYRKVLKHLQEHNIFSPLEYGTIYLREGLPNNIANHVGSFISLPKEITIEAETILDEGKYICMYKKGGYYDEEGVRRLLKWVEENGYQVDSDIVEFCLIDFTYTNSDAEMIEELQVKVK